MPNSPASNAALTNYDAALLRAGKQLSAGRRKVIPQLAKAASRQLADLGFKQSKFDVAISSQLVGDEVTSLKSKESQSLLTSAPASNGFDTIEFQFSPNVGEPAKPLRAIASSGEWRG